MHSRMKEALYERRAAIRGGVVIALILAIATAAYFAGRRSSLQSHPGLSGVSATQAASDHGHGEAQLWTCSMHPQVIQPEPGICPICHMELTPLKSGGGEAGMLTIDPVIVQNMGVRTAEVVRGPVVQSVRAVGYLEEPEPLHRDINLRVNGWIEKLYADVDGMAIEKGKPLFDLYSPELVVGIDELIAARKQIERNPTDTTTRGLMDSARRKLSQYGLEPAQIDSLAKLDTAPSSVSILAPIDGHLTAKMVYEGASVKAGDLVLRLASRHQMWIDAQVPESQMPLISNGQPVRATLVSQPGKIFTGKVLFVHPHVDPQTRTALARVEIENHDLALRQGMYATVDILADAYREAPMVPSEAVINTGLRQVVFVSLGDGRFAAREVKLGLPGQDGTVEVVEGLTEGEQIVTSGQFLLDSESRLKDAVAKHLSAGLSSHPAGAVAAAATSAPATTQRGTERVVLPHVDDILQKYLVLAKALGARQEADTPVDVQPLLDMAQMAQQHATDAAKPLAAAVADAARSMSGKPLAAQRESFVALSDAVVAVARKARFSKGAADALFVVHCPMAFEDKGADWLQDNDSIANPYYATRMKRCGEVVERIDPIP